MNVHLIHPRELFGPPERQAELQFVWEQNDKVFDLSTEVNARRCTFTDLFKLALPETINIIANSDIFFEKESIDLIVRNLKPGDVYALSKWDVLPDGNIKHYKHVDSQDAWVFFGKPDITADFNMGVAGCDNSLAHIFKEAGCTVSNPSLTIRALHLHNVKWRSYLLHEDGSPRSMNVIERIPPPYHLVPITAL